MSIQEFHPPPGVERPDKLTRAKDFFGYSSNKNMWSARELDARRVALISLVSRKA